MTTYDEVIFQELPGQGGQLGWIKLNRPRALNALNGDMIRALFAKLTQWAAASHIKAVVITATEGRAFCAGGDLRTLYEHHQQHDPQVALFFKEEYELNRFIFHYPKPYIAFLDGITMGGGVGISVHGSHRVATDRLLFAMPETGIGFFPDVGGTYFLPRLPGKLGFYLGLTGARLNGDDCVAIGIATHKMVPASIPACISALAEKNFSADARLSVTEVLQSFQVPVATNTLLSEQEAINLCFSASTMEEILQRLQQSAHPLCQEAAVAITQKSPTSLKVTLKALQQGALLSMDACIQQEYQLACTFLAEHDFLEGIRAVIIDKDHNPHWQPASLEAVTAAIIDPYFASQTKVDC